MAELTDEIRDSMTEEGLEFTSNELGKAFMWVSSRVMRDMIFEDKKRIDGRGIRELRQLAAETNVMPVVHGSSIFERGNTQALATVAIGTLLNAQKLDAPVGPESRRMMLHYSFPSFSINETPRRGGLSRREIGHGALAEKSLAGIIPPARDWPFAVRINAETMESNGSSSMAAVCSGSLALMDAGVPIKEHVGAISVGLVMDEDESSGEVTRYELLSDIMGLEDVLGDMDFKIAGTRGGITGIQLDCKPAGIPLDILIEAMDIASVARGAVIDEMDRAIPKPRSGEAISENSSQFTTVRMNRSLIGRLIGPKGDNIRELERSTGAKVSIHEESAKVPLIICVPGKKPAVCNSLTELIDLYPTVSKLCGLKIPGNIQGKDISGMLDDPAVKVRDAVLSSGKGRLLRTEKWALLDYGNKGELYDMEKDPKQYDNLFGDSNYAETLAELKAKLKAKLSEIAENDLPSKK